jgi:hypothetical protein
VTGATGDQVSVLTVTVGSGAVATVVTVVTVATVVTVVTVVTVATAVTVMHGSSDSHSKW